MTKDRAESNLLTELRKRAKARLEGEAMHIPDMSPEVVRKLVHELRTHQIELEMQNEELRRAQGELVESHGRYADLYDFAPVGYVTVSHKSLILEANLTLAEMLGVERGALAKQPLSAFIVPEDQDVYYRYRREILESKQRDTCRLRMLRRNAEPLWVEMDSILIEAGDETDARLRTVISDITERKQVEEERRQLEVRIHRVQKFESLSVMAGSIAHHLNNLLAVILGNLELTLRDLPPGSPAERRIKQAGKAGRRAADLSTLMLTYVGRTQTRMQTINMGEIVQEITPMLETSVPEKIVLRFSLSPASLLFTGDPAQIQQIIMNLLTNAWEAIGDVEGEIVLSTGTMFCDRSALRQPFLEGDLPEGDYVYVDVSDTGCGMDEETLGKVFDPFFTTKFTGRGLGMAAVLGMVRTHQGAISLESAPGKGTTVKVLFPGVEASEETQRRLPEQAETW